MDLTAYLRRINYRDSLEPTLQTLQSLQGAHLLTVPYENLEFQYGVKTVFDENVFFQKIVNRHRGGNCYELNGLFAALLRMLGFEVSLLSAAVVQKTGNFGMDYEHLTLLVKLQENWLVDVGFGFYSFRKPLRLAMSLEQIQDKASYRFTCEDNYWFLQQRNRDNLWETRYRFSLQPCQLTDFAATCHYHQTSQESHFYQRRICTRATSYGRITLVDLLLFTIADEKVKMRLLADQNEYDAVLSKYFEIDQSQ